MEISGQHITLRESEIKDSACPLDPKWAAGLIRRLGLDAALESKRVSRYVTCPTVLEAAGYSVEVVPDDQQLGDQLGDQEVLTSS